MKLVIITFLLTISFIQLNANEHFGTYSYDLKPNSPEGRFGEIYISGVKNVYTFNISLCRGAPSYNLGELIGEVVVENNEGIFYKQSEYNENKVCEWKIKFYKDKLILETLNGNTECGFGYGVYVDAIYYKEPKVQNTYGMKPKKSVH